MKIITTLLTILSALFITGVHAQYSISGKVTDDDDKPLADVNVSLLNAGDSSWISTVYTTEDGTYSFKKLQAGKYSIHCQNLSFIDARKQVDLFADVKGLDIVMIASTSTLQTAVVRSDRKKIETELGKTIVNVNKEMKAGKNLLDLLKEVPGVMVTPDGDVSVTGKQGITLFIDGKPVLFTGKELTAYLKGVGADNVDKIELLTQPSAKYDASGNSGILLVKLNKKKREGWSGNANANYIQSRYPFVSGGGRLAYRKNKVGVYIAPGGYIGNGFLISDKQRVSKDIITQEELATIDEHSFLRETFYDYNTELGLDYDFTDRTQISASVRGVYHPNVQWDAVDAEITDNITRATITNISKGDKGFLRKNLTGNLYLRHEVDSTSRLTVNGHYFTETKDIYQNITGVNYNEQSNVLSDGLMLQNDIPIASSIYSVNADYEKSFSKGARLEAGVKSSYVPINDANNFETLVNTAWVKDTVRTNHFLYDEYLNSGYVNASAQNGKWQAQAGVRVEHTYADGHELTQDNKFVRNYVSVFPTAFVGCKVDSNNSLEVNYGKRIKRPFYRELNPFTNFASQYAQSSGNPYLLPMFTHRIEIKHNYKGHFITTLELDKQINAFTQQLLFDVATKVSNYSTTNNGQVTGGALTAFYNGEIRDWLNVSVVGQAGYNEFSTQYNNKHYRASRMNVYMSIDTQFKLKNGWAASLHSRYAGPYMVDAFREVGGSVWMSSNVSKSMFNDTLVVKVSLQDPFNLYRSNELISLPNNEVTSTTQYSAQNFALALSYNFGKNDNKNRGKLNTDEIKRM